MKAALILLDRTAILFLGVAAGAAIGYAFGVRQQADLPVLAGAPEAGIPLDEAALAPPPPGPDGREAPPAATGTPAEPPVVAETRPILPGIVNAVEAGRPIRVGVFGDSFGDGIWSALYHQLSRKAGYEIVKFSQQATGFTRYKTLNLEEHDRARLARNPVDIAVISFGANDMMGVADGRRVHALLTPGWKDVIARRVTAYVAMLREQGAIVYWVGLPRMRDASYDADVARMNAFYRELMGRLGVAFVETAPYSVDGDGRYAAYLPDPATGKPVLIRANDGIHMSVNGYIRITRRLAGRIRSYVDQARSRAGADAPPPPVVPLSPAAVPARPAPKPQPKLDDPLGGNASEPARPARPAAPAAEPAIPPARGAPIDLLPPEMRGPVEDVEADDS